MYFTSSVLNQESGGAKEMIKLPTQFVMSVQFSVWHETDNSENIHCGCHFPFSLVKTRKIGSVAMEMMKKMILQSTRKWLEHSLLETIDKG